VSRGEEKNHRGKREESTWQHEHSGRDDGGQISVTARKYLPVRVLTKICMAASFKGCVIH